MKKEFTAAAKKMKATEKVPHEEATTNTKITLTVGGVSITVDQQTAASITSAVAATAPAAKKAKVAKDSVATPKKKLYKDDAPAAKPKKSAQHAESNKSKPSATTEKSAKKAATTKSQVNPTEAKPQEKVAPAKTKAIPKPKILSQRPNQKQNPSPRGHPKKRQARLLYAKSRQLAGASLSTPFQTTGHLASILNTHTETLLTTGTIFHISSRSLTKTSTALVFFIYVLTLLITFLSLTDLLVFPSTTISTQTSSGDASSSGPRLE
jgi:hypothetical protein